MKRLLRTLPCLLLCLLLLGSSASADMGPKQSVTITVTNAPEGVYYLDLLHQADWDYSNVDLEEYDPDLIQGFGAGRTRAGIPPWLTAPTYPCSAI